MHEDDDREPAATTAEQVLGATLGAGVGVVLLPSPYGDVVGAALSPPAVNLARRVLTELRDYRTVSATGVVEGACDRLGTTPEELEAEARRDPPRLQLLAEAIEAGWHTINERKVRALAQAVANGLRQDLAMVENERIMVAAIADLEEPHIRVLLFMASELPVTEPVHVGLKHQEPVTPAQIIEVLDPHGKASGPLAVRPIMAALTRNYLVTPVDAWTHELDGLRTALEELRQTTSSDLQRLGNAHNEELEKLRRKVEETPGVGPQRVEFEPTGGSRFREQDFRTTSGESVPVEWLKSYLASKTEPVAEVAESWRLTQFGLECARYLSPDEVRPQGTG